MVSAKLGSDPADTSRKAEVPVGLKVLLMFQYSFHNLIITQNLGATCYANASLQVSLVPLIPALVLITIGVVS